MDTCKHDRGLRIWFAVAADYINRASNPVGEGVNFSCGTILRLTDASGLEPEEDTLVNMTETSSFAGRIPDTDS
jgi:hypothetical protein